LNRKTLLIIASGFVVLFTSVGALLARATPNSSPYSYLTIFTNVLHLVDSNYVEDVDFNKVMDSAMYGMVESLDSESYFIKGKDLEQYKKDIAALDTQAGVGLTIARRFGMVVVVAVEKGSSAEQKKIKAGDFIRSVNGEYVQGIPLYRIYQQMRGNPGTEVKMSLFRGALEKPEDHVLVRQAVSKPYTESYVIQQNIGYIGIRHLMPGVEDETQKKLEAYQRQGIKKLILDLRGCTEDNQDLAVKVSDLFVPAVPIVQISGRQGTIQKITGEPQKLFTGELLTLIDYTTAGGAEIIAGAIQDSGVGKAFGTRSFGRGGIQTLLPAGQNWVVLTTKKYMTPKGKIILTNGIEPVLAYKENVKTADQEEGVDRLLNDAIERLRHQTAKAAA
jgi:carboxyl-terminal processing protease